VDLQGGVAGEHLEAELAGGLTTGCKQIFHEWIYLEEKRRKNIVRLTACFFLSEVLKANLNPN
jgi:hypothetical protein